MRRSTRLSLFFFVIGFCCCLLLTVIVRFFVSIEWENDGTSTSEVVFYKVGECPECKAISREYWKIGRLKDNNDMHLESARRLGIQPFNSNAELEDKVAGLVVGQAEVDRRRIPTA